MISTLNTKANRTFVWALLAINALLFSVVVKAEDDKGPFVPATCESGSANVSDLKEIQNMPPIKTQDTMGDCRAFSLATVIQKFVCDNSKNDDGSKMNCTNPSNTKEKEKQISYFGMMIYTNSNQANLKTLQPDQDIQLTAESVIKKITDDGEGFVLDSCKPFDKFANNFSFENNYKDKRAEKFLKYTQDLYNNRKKATEATAVEDCPDCLKQLSNMTGLDENVLNLKQALSKKSYDEFLYTLLFADCKLKGVSRGFRQVYYPQNNESLSNEDLKNKIKQGLSADRPILYPYLCAETVNGKCKGNHSIVISGYKKVCCGGKCTDAFKVHNSWGQEWQDRNNGGWVFADHLLDQTTKVDKKFQKASVIWLE